MQRVKAEHACFIQFVSPFFRVGVWSLEDDPGHKTWVGVAEQCLDMPSNNSCTCGLFRSGCMHPGQMLGCGRFQVGFGANHEDVHTSPKDVACKCKVVA